MQGKVCIVTGATAGIGEVTALELARMGATVVVISRSEAKCRATVDRIRAETGNGAWIFWWRTWRPRRRCGGWRRPFGQSMSGWMCW